MKVAVITACEGAPQAEGCDAAAGEGFGQGSEDTLL